MTKSLNTTNEALSAQLKIFYLNHLSVYSSKPLVLCYLHYFYFYPTFLLSIHKQHFHPLPFPLLYHPLLLPPSKVPHNASSPFHPIHSPPLASLLPSNYKVYNPINLVQWPTNKLPPSLKPSSLILPPITSMSITHSSSMLELLHSLSPFYHKSPIMPLLHSSLEPMASLSLYNPFSPYNKPTV